ncbi:MAG: hypothetical protein AWU54_436 [Candidatus Frackibacter sp. T328-2]|nr:MAG: hypothetical protein AWU54_436 [Candidatus Frackibacter sp. T328-2]
MGLDGLGVHVHCGCNFEFDPVIEPEFEEGKDYMLEGKCVMLEKVLEGEDKEGRDAVIYDDREDEYKVIDVRDLEEMKEVKEGLLVKGLPAGDEKYNITDDRMLAGVVFEKESTFYTGFRIKVLDHEDQTKIGNDYSINKSGFWRYFEEIKIENVFDIGDYVKGVGNNPCRISNGVKLGKIVGEDDEEFKIKILKHSTEFYHGKDVFVKKKDFALNNEKVNLEEKPDVKVGDHIKMLDIGGMSRFTPEILNYNDEYLVVGLGDDNFRANGLHPCSSTFVLLNKGNNKLIRIGYYSYLDWRIL